MRKRATLEAALGLSAPWKVTDDTFSVEEKRLDIMIDFEPGSTFSCPICGAEGAKAYDTQERTWRHLNFFPSGCFATSMRPKYMPAFPVSNVQRDAGSRMWKCPGHARAAASRRCSSKILTREALIMVMAREMLVAAIAALVGEHDTRIWRVIHHHVEEARREADFSWGEPRRHG